MESKQNLRSEQRALRLAKIDTERRKYAAQRLEAALAADPEFLAAKVVLLYADMPDEVPTGAIIERWQSEKTLLLPSIRQGTLQVSRYLGREALRPGSFGILEPTNPPFLSLESIDFVLIPGVAFDRNGGRLGHGKAYYDRFLAQPSLQGVRRVGVCFDFQVVSAVPVETHDVLLHRLIVV